MPGSLRPAQTQPSLHCRPLPSGATRVLAVALGERAFLFFPVALLTGQDPSQTVTPETLSLAQRPALCPLS